MSPPGFETVIGLEVHCQLAVTHKLFSPASYAFGGEPNSRVDVVDLGLPGVLPALDAAALALAIRAGLAFEGAIQAQTHFDRKNYFYPDLPKGYQISQFDAPFCVGGRVPLGDGRWWPLTRIHLEEDAGKSIHAGGESLVDLNRAGVALIEIVSEPERATPADAHAFLEHLQRIVRYAGISDGDMEKGALRCDANISLRAAGHTTLGTKVEIKNLNSIKMVQRALEYEERRQAALLAAGGRVRQETRLWNEEQGETAPMRTKESAHDYRYFPDPDLPPLTIPPGFVATILAAMPELPGARRARYLATFELPERDVDQLISEKTLGDYFEAVAAHCGDGKSAFNWIATEVLREMHERSLERGRFPLPAADLGALIRAVADGTINRGAGRRVLSHLCAHPGVDTAAAIAALGVGQIRDRATLTAVVDSVLGQNATAVAAYRAGQDKVWHNIKGLCMRATEGRADPALLDELLRARLAPPA